MVELPESKNYYLYLDESGNFNDTDDNRSGSLIGGVLCYDEIQSLSVAKQIISKVRNEYLKDYPAYENFNFYHATAFPDNTPEEKEIKANIKFDMFNAIIENQYGFIPIVFNQSSKVSIKDSTTNYIMFLVDGLVKLIQDCSFQKNFHLTVTLGGRRDIAREEEFERKNHSKKIFYVQLPNIKAEFDKYMAMAKVREQYSFKNNFTITFRSADDHSNELLVLSDYICNSFFTQRTFRGQMQQQYQKYAKKIHVYQIAEEPNVERLKRYMADGNYSMALFYAMGTDTNSAEYKTFRENFKFALKRMTTAEKEIILAHYGQLLKRLLDVYRNSDEVISLIDKTMKFIGGDKETLGECLNEFVANLRLYKMTAVTHLGKINQFRRIAEDECFPAIKAGGNLELYIIYVNRMIVHFQDVFDYAESLELGNKILNLLDDLIKPLSKFNEENGTNFTIYEDQYFRICGSLALTCYLTLSNSHENLELARECSKIALNGFIRTSDKMRTYQTLAQIEAEAENFETACEMLDKGINITIKNPAAEQFKNFRAFDWYHFAKFSERLLNSADKKYFEIAKRAIEISRQEFLNYRNKIGNAPEHPDYITFSKMGACFNILGDTSLSMQLYSAALRGVDEEIGENISVNANAAAFRLVMLANYLMTLEKNNKIQKADEIIKKLKYLLSEYLTQVNIDSMKIPFDGWQDLLENIAKNSVDKFAIPEKMSRAILL